MNIVGCSSFCSYRGACLSMSQLAMNAQSNGVLLGYTYGFPNTPTAATWDHNMIQGCECDRHNYYGPLKWDLFDFAGYDCSLSKYTFPPALISVLSNRDYLIGKLFFGKKLVRLAMILLLLRK